MKTQLSMMNLKAIATLSPVLCDWHCNTIGVYTIGAFGFKKAAVNLQHAIYDEGMDSDSTQKTANVEKTADSGSAKMQQDLVTAGELKENDDKRPGEVVQNHKAAKHDVKQLLLKHGNYNTQHDDGDALPESARQPLFASFPKFVAKSEKESETATATFGLPPASARTDTSGLTDSQDLKTFVDENINKSQIQSITPQDVASNLEEKYRPITQGRESDNVGSDFHTIDTDGDGQVSREEFSDWLKTLDTNSDGKTSKTEWEATGRTWPAALAEVGEAQGQMEKINGEPQGTNPEAILEAIDTLTVKTSEKISRMKDTVDIIETKTIWSVDMKGEKKEIKDKLEEDLGYIKFHAFTTIPNYLHDLELKRVEIIEEMGQKMEKISEGNAALSQMIVINSKTEELSKRLENLQKELETLESELDAPKSGPNDQTKDENTDAGLDFNKHI